MGEWILRLKFVKRKYGGMGSMRWCGKLLVTASLKCCQPLLYRFRIVIMNIYTVLLFLLKVDHIQWLNTLDALFFLPGLCHEYKILSKYQLQIERRHTSIVKWLKVQSHLIFLNTSDENEWIKSPWLKRRERKKKRNRIASSRSCNLKETRLW